MAIDKSFKGQFWELWIGRIKKKYKITPTAAFLRFAWAILEPKVQTAIFEVLDEYDGKMDEKLKQFDLQTIGKNIGNIPDTGGKDVQKQK